MSVELTKDELHMIRYALQELGSRRLEQAIDRKDTSQGSPLRVEADRHFMLATKLSNYISNAPS